MKTLEIMNTVTGERAILCDDSQPNRDMMHKLVGILRRNDAKQGAPGADGWTVIERDSDARDREAS